METTSEKPYVPETQISDERLEELIATYRLHNTLERLGRAPRGSEEDVKVGEELDEVLVEYKRARDACAEADKKRRAAEDERWRELGIIK